jgi:hypothetical protein
LSNFGQKSDTRVRSFSSLRRAVHPFLSVLQSASTGTGQEDSNKISGHFIEDQMVQHAVLHTVTLQRDPTFSIKMTGDVRGSSVSNASSLIRKTNQITNCNT